MTKFWNSLPHQVQGLVVFFLGSFAGALAKYVTVPGACLTLNCWQEYLGQSLSFGLVAVIGLYTKSSFYQPPKEN